MEFTPSDPRDIKIHRDEKNPTEIKINWTEPESPNGIIDHYEILMELRRIDEERIMQRPFCQKQYEIKTFVFEDDDAEAEPKEPVVDDSGTCSCRNCPSDREVPTAGTDPVSRAKQNEEAEFENALIDAIWHYNGISQLSEQENPDVIVDQNKKRDKREIATDSRNKQKDITENQTVTSIAKEAEGNASKDLIETLKPGARPVRTRVVRVVNSSITTLRIDKLRHFGQYSLKIRACHRKGEEDKYAIGRERCSIWTNEEVQTYPDKDADNVGAICKVGYNCKNPTLDKTDDKTKNQTDLDTTDKKQENKGEPVFISWTAPSDPNLLIVNYKIKIQNDAGSQELESCFTAKQYQANDNR